MLINYVKYPVKYGSDGIKAPRCDNPDCEGHHAQNTGHQDKHGNIRYRKTPIQQERFGGEGYACGKCHINLICEKRKCTPRQLDLIMMERAAAKKGMTLKEYLRELNGAGTEWYEGGYDSFADYKENFLDLYNWKVAKKDYCENINSLLGEPCLTIFKPDYGGLNNTQLELDHLDGNPTNECEDNAATWCHECHKLKTRIFEDHASDGRKTLGLNK